MENQSYKRLVTLATWLATAVAFILLVIKSIAFVYSGAVSILASMIDSLMDIGMSLVNLFAVRYALQPPDEEHRFGHGKAEHLAGLIQAAFISGSAVMLIYGGITALWRQAPLEHNELGLWVMGVSTLLTIALVLFQRYVIARTNNTVIKADSLHYVMDIFMNAAVMVALGLSLFGWYWADGLFAILIAIYICWGALKIGKDSIQNLLDRELPDEVKHDIFRLVREVKGVEGVHDIRTRQSGNTKFIQLHIELDDHLDLFTAHQISDSVEAKLQQQWPEADVLIHQDPVSVVPLEKRQQFKDQ